MECAARCVCISPQRAVKPWVYTESFTSGGCAWGYIGPPIHIYASHSWHSTNSNPTINHVGDHGNAPSSHALPDDKENEGMDQ